MAPDSYVFLYVNAARASTVRRHLHKELQLARKHLVQNTSRVGKKLLSLQVLESWFGRVDDRQQPRDDGRVEVVRQSRFFFVRSL